MSVMMLGVVEAFSLITRTASGAEALHGAHQQMRALLDHLNRDVRGLAREGYLSTSNAPATGAGGHHTDTLAFVSIGPWRGMRWSDEPGKVNKSNASAAELVYTTKVQTPDRYPWQLPQNEKLGPRRGVLGRGVWVMTGHAGGGGDRDEKSEAAFLGQLLNGERAPRISKSSGTRLVVAPWLRKGTASSDPQTLRRVMTTCTSEFFVEYWKVDFGKRDGGEWVNEAKTFSTGSANDWPAAIRVTVAVHDPTETAPPEGNTEGVPQRFRGYALQEVFWIGDP